MGDNKKWFKVWTSILIDPKHSNMSLKDVGRWTRLGALMVSQGENGMLILYPPANTFLVAMECPTFEAAIDALKVLPNVHIEECKSDNGKTIVIMRNWFKYQVDPTAYERVKRSRYKRRGEEKRSLTSTSTSSPSATQPPPQGASATRETALKAEWQKTAADLPESEQMKPEDWAALKDKFKTS